MSTRSRPPRTPASAEPKPVMLRGTGAKTSRGNDLLQSGLIREEPACSVELQALGVAHPVELELEVRLRPRRAPKPQLSTERVLPAEAPAAPRFDGHFGPQGEDAAAIDAPELRVERRRHAGVMRR